MPRQHGEAPDRAEVVLFYDVSGPNLVFGEALRQVAQQQQRSLSENARALALLSCFR